MECRKCGACCIALSISSAIPGMPDGKPAGVPCVKLTDDGLCALFGSTDRPAVCSAFPPMPDTCGSDSREAFLLLTDMEQSTRPN